MKLIINAGSVYKGGSEQVALSFINECIGFPQNDYHVVIAPNLSRQLNLANFPDNFTFHQIRRRPASGLLNFARMMIWYRKLETKVKPDCVISTGGHGNWRPKAPLIGGFNIPHYVYPESPYFRTLSFQKRLYWKLMRWIQLLLYNRLDAILVQTEDVKSRLSGLLSSGAPVHVISNTAGAHFFRKVTSRPRLPERTRGEIRLLTLSSYYPHKNLEVINQVSQILKRRGESRFKFVVTLPEEQFIRVFGADSTEMIFNAGPIPINECPSLYDECDFMFLPTLLECFSASYAEAMVMKKPILTSDLSFARTVCHDAAIYFNPMDPDEIADRIVSLADNPEKQRNIIREGERIALTFNTPYERADKFLKICQMTTELKKIS